MYRLLLVEDQELAREALRMEFSRILPDLKVTTAATFEEAKKEILESAADNRPFRFAVLDRSIPKGGATVVDTELPELLRRVNPSTVVIHCTAFAHSDEVKRHMDAYYGGPSGAIVVEKFGAWDQDLMRRLVNSKFNIEYARVFGLSEADQGGRNGGTIAESELVSTIEEQWAYLSEESRQLARSRFRIRVESGDSQKSEVEGAAGE